MLNRRQLVLSSLATSSAMLLKAAPLHAFAPATAADFQPVRKSIQIALKQQWATSVAVAVVHRGQIVWEEGFGFADYENKVASTPRTPYCLASITKTFTAALVAELADGKQLSLDSAAVQHLRTSWLRGPNGDPNRVTIRMLGAHCSGLPETFAAHLTDGPAPAEPSSAFLADYGCLAYPPGLIYEYGNIGFEVLGAIVQNITGQAFGLALENRVLRPLGLRDSFFSSRIESISASAIGYDDQGKRIPLYRTSTPPSGELYSSAHDLARFALFHLGCSDKAHALSERVIREARIPVFKGPRDISSTFGWFTGRLAGGEEYLFKTGGQPGVAAKIFLLPSIELGCAVLTNRTDNMPLVDECCAQILRTYHPDFVMPQEDAGPGSSVFRPTPEIIGEWQGKLVNGGANQIVRFSMTQDGTGTLALSDRAPEPLNDLRSQAPGFEGVTNGLVDCREASAFGKRALVFKLVPQQGKLVGRVTAKGTRPGLLVANIPYVLTLERT